MAYVSLAVRAHLEHKHGHLPAPKRARSHVESQHVLRVTVVIACSIWATGQDQCASIKRMLAAMLPGVSIFLDVHQQPTIRAGLYYAMPASIASQGR